MKIQVVVKRGNICVSHDVIVGRCVWLDKLWERGMVPVSVLVGVWGGDSV